MDLLQGGPAGTVGKAHTFSGVPSAPQPAAPEGSLADAEQDKVHPVWTDAGGGEEIKRREPGAWGTKVLHLVWTASDKVSSTWGCLQNLAVSRVDFSVPSSLHDWVAMSPSPLSNAEALRRKRDLYSRCQGKCPAEVRRGESTVHMGWGLFFYTTPHFTLNTSLCLGGRHHLEIPDLIAGN